MTETRPHGVLIGAPCSGSGKTVFTLGLLAALKKKGLPVRSFKCGPDYIDPMYHSKVLGIPCRNLDTWFTGEEKTGELYSSGNDENTISVIEGVMGLYDGVAGIRPEGSSYDLARALGLPVILVISAGGVGRSLIAVIRGFKAMDQYDLIRGVFINKISDDMYNRLKPEIEKVTGVSCLGFLPREEKLHAPERHLGLVAPGETDKGFTDAAGEAVEKALDWNSFFRISVYPEKNETAVSQDRAAEHVGKSSRSYEDRGAEGVTLAVAKDPAFSFIYEDNLRELKSAGVNIRFFSPVRDQALPDGISGLYLPGGYPELYLPELAENSFMRRDILEKIEGGLPTVAECGGFLYLGKSIKDSRGVEYPMVGLLPGKAERKGKSGKFGYVTVEEVTPAFLPKGITLKGHEFHYYESTEEGESCRMVKPVTEKSWTGIFTTETLWAGFPHIYFPAEPEFVRVFSGKMRKYSMERL